MKFYETHFEEYTTKTKTENLHPKLDKLFSKFPANLTNLKNLIFYGPSGVGKYSQMLHLIQKYSPTNLKYEKKIIVKVNRNGGGRPPRISTFAAFVFDFKPTYFMSMLRHFFERH